MIYLVEKIIINPIKVRGYGNIVEDHSLTDYSTSESIMSKITETVNGVLAKVYTLSYSLYGFMFGFDDDDVTEGFWELCSDL